MLKIIISGLIILLFPFLSKADSIEIRYQAPKAKQVKIIWGINDWNYFETKPVGTVIKNNVMETPMRREGGDYVVNFNLPANTTLDYLFYFSQDEGPVNFSIGYLDQNNPGKKNFHHNVNGNLTIKHKADFTNVTPSTTISIFSYSIFFFLFFGILAALVYTIRKFAFRNFSTPLQHSYLFAAIGLSLLCILVIIRAMVADLVVPFLAAPTHALPAIFKTAQSDFFYTFFLTVVFGVLFYTLKSKRSLVLYFFAGFSVLSIVVSLVNIKIIALLGKPFTYQWLYYSDFLKSSEAKSAIMENVDKDLLLAYLVMILAAGALVSIFYQILIKKPILIIVFFAACIAIGIFKENGLVVPAKKMENPITYFLTSLIESDGIPYLPGQNNGYQGEFNLKNKNVMPVEYVNKFARAKITNVIVFVLESTPAEYLTVYNPDFKTTPFMDSIKSSAAIFDNIYSHAPTTNISLPSLLCGMYPYLSSKTLTASKPDIKWPSISSELEKAGYRNSFLNSADNRYNGAGDFIQNRGFNEIQDFRQNPCNVDTYDNKRFGIANLDGMNDACLPVKFFNWIGTKDTSYFFSLMWTFQTHYPYYPTGSMIDFKTKNNSQEKYLNALNHSDKVLQQLVAGLQERGLLESTLIVIVGDHGEAFGRHGQTSHAGGIFEENLHIPCMLINAKLFNGEHFSTIGGMSDIAPTIFSILNKPIPEIWQGENLFSINRSKRVYYFNPYTDFLFGCREGDYKLIFNATMDTTALFNIKNDPFETVNIASQQPALVEDTKNHVLGWIQYQTNFVNKFLK